ncbi:hypothetical protein [Clostridium magnum]|uniref:Uncharacterized protein n=1 Tax=Clostridium magnum DSM 2767 TaxID=1121326 RepID=A0A161Y411_9CLOT|nr:hypothetical protein [Clostridium magnum]KZL92839.1 hypothetical protein CLMAG_26530 [Clostridium magnum DSM 2767]SHI28416.1 hypothetical protein SAMN02745944_03991 [Clostridium magnum DSM 2767]
MNNNKLTYKNSHIIINPMDIMAKVKAFQINPEHSCVSLQIVNGIVLSFNWASGKFDFSRVS